MNVGEFLNNNNSRLSVILNKGRRICIVNDKVNGQIVGIYDLVTFMQPMAGSPFFKVTGIDITEEVAKVGLNNQSVQGYNTDPLANYELFLNQNKPINIELHESGYSYMILSEKL